MGQWAIVMFEEGATRELETFTAAGCSDLAVTITLAECNRSHVAVGIDPAKVLLLLIEPNRAAGDRKA
jgi:hypothetical protein